MKNLHRNTQVVLFGMLLCVATPSERCKVVAEEVAEADPKRVAEDPDFRIQGEYTDTTRGVQVVARGDGVFDVVIYNGGLPGAGWDGKGKQKIEMESDQLDAMLENFDRADRKSPTLGAKPPQGAVVLFDGTKASLEAHWKDGAKISEDGLLMQGCTSKDLFQDYTLHLEFRTPFMPEARGQGRGNSGVYHQGRYETQVLDSFGEEGKNNESGGIYSIRDPNFNACLPPMTWQTYDVDFTAAVYDASGKQIRNPRITVKLNGMVVQRDVELTHKTTAAPLGPGPEPGPIYLQDHGNPVRYRNIWVLPRDVAAEVRRPIVPGFGRFHQTGQDPVEGGQLLLSELNCVACHDGLESAVGLRDSKQAPVLDRVGSRVRPEWMLEFIANPHQAKPGTTMPDVMVGMSDEERLQAAKALTSFLVGDDAMLAGGQGANTAAGKQLFHQSGCVACHAPIEGDRVASATSVPLVGLDKKYSRASLEAFLKDPLAVRPSGRMPRMDLGGDNWRHVAQYLTGDTDASLSPSRDLPKTPNMRFSAYYQSVDQLPDLDKLEPDLTGISRGLDITVGKRDTAVILRFEGILPIKQAGEYQFQLMSDDGSALYLDDKKVIDNDGVHAEVTKSAGLRLTAGNHTIRVDWFEKDGGEALALAWSGPGVKSSRTDHAVVLNAEDVEEVAATDVAEEPDPIVDPSLRQLGKSLFESLGCAGCHERKDGGQSLVSKLPAPSFAAMNFRQGCLGETPPVNFDLTSIQRGAIVAATGEAASVEKPSEAEMLAQTMKSLNCYACHERDRLGGAESDRNPLFLSQIPEMGDEGRLPPPLTQVGDKLRADWIKKVVASGDKSRPYMRTMMPGFGRSHAEAIAGWFQTVDELSEAEIAETEESGSRRVSTGRKLVGAKGLACISCHTYGKYRSTGIQAIALDTMASRIREDWFHRYLPDPQKYRPGTRMPNGFPDGKSTVKDVYAGHTGKQTTAIWAFLEKGDQGGVPDGIVGGMIELKPENGKPVIYRNFIEGVSPRGIAVGYPEAVNLCWDAESMSLGLIWQDRFIDASKHWVGRGPGNQTPLGGSVISFEPMVPLAVLNSASDAWPNEPPRQRGYRFLGYRLDAKGRPEFRYRTPFGTVADKPVPSRSGGEASFRRSLSLQRLSDVNADNVYFRAARGKIAALEDGWYLVDGEYRIRIESPSAPFVRASGGADELLVPIESDSSELQQEIIW